MTFWVGGLLTVVAAMLAMTRRHPLACVLWLLVAFLGMATLFISLNAGFLGVIQVLVYAGAILVLFLFVIMLLRLSPAGLVRLDRPRTALLGIGAAGGVVAVFWSVAAASAAWTQGGTADAIAARRGATDFGQTLPISNQLFERHLIPFEVTSVLLLVAIVGVVAITKKKV